MDREKKGMCADIFIMHGKSPRACQPGSQRPHILKNPIVAVGSSSRFLIITTCNIFALASAHRAHLASKNTQFYSG